MNGIYPHKASLIVLDIETYRTRNAAIVEKVTQAAIEKEPAQNTAKELKMAWNTEQAREERVAVALDKTAVNPLYAEVLCVCAKADYLEHVIVFDGMTEIETREDYEGCEYYKKAMDVEEFMLRELAQWLEAVMTPLTILAGHNIEAFDLGILLNRWRVYRITPPSCFPVYKNGHWRGQTFDTMQRIPNNGAGFISLNESCAVMGIAGKADTWHGVPVSGGLVGTMFESGDFEAILDYCSADVLIELDLYNKLTANGQWGTYGLRNGVAEQLAEIDAAELGEGAKALAKLSILERAGLVPK
jgi:hypothetical protein